MLGRDWHKKAIFAEKVRSGLKSFFKNLFVVSTEWLI